MVIFDRDRLSARVMASPAPLEDDLILLARRDLVARVSDLVGHLRPRGRSIPCLSAQHSGRVRRGFSPACPIPVAQPSEGRSIGAVSATKGDEET
jgi:hypothetical protein